MNLFDILALAAWCAGGLLAGVIVLIIISFMKGDSL